MSVNLIEAVNILLSLGILGVMALLTIGMFLENHKDKIERHKRKKDHEEK